MAFIFILLFLLFPGFAHAQTASIMDGVLESPELNRRQAAYFVLTASEGARTPHTFSNDMDTAFSFAVAQRWLPEPGDSPVNLGELSYLIMQAFELKGGFLYRTFPGPHYAYRELAYRRLIPPPGDPARGVTGERFLQILGNVLSLVGDREL
ncbi:hypothetical protein [Treponema primitia]|uniref:hypothetical protein n=1 Tax=Treponema primitia TaxID=88058 RepID=UPI000686A9F0|nr:hypothetical protein [Treponema primitia]